MSLISYVAQPLAAAFAIVPVFYDMAAKSAEQTGKQIPHMTALDRLKGGMKIAPTTGAVVGSQMILQKEIEENLFDEENLQSMFASSAIVGAISSPILAVFNGKTMGWSVAQSLRRFSAKQAAAITLQESAFIAGISAAKPLASALKSTFGDNKVVEYTSAFLSGAFGSLAGHPANTALTLWQNRMVVLTPKQLMLGAARKARAVGVFSVLYKIGKEQLQSL